MVTVEQAIAKAERILPGTAAPGGEEDSRWQVIIEVGRFVESHPEEVWAFPVKWGCHSDEDLRSAIATCLVGQLPVHPDDLPTLCGLLDVNGVLTRRPVRVSYAHGANGGTVRLGEAHDVPGPGT